MAKPPKKEKKRDEMPQVRVQEAPKPPKAYAGDSKMEGHSKFAKFKREGK